MRISDWSSDVCSSDLPGTPSLMHRIGGIEKNVGTGHSDYDPANHQAMTEMRANKVLGVADSVAPQEVCLGEEGGKLAVVGWGSTYGPIHQAVRRMRKRGLDVRHIPIRSEARSVGKKCDRKISTQRSTHNETNKSLNIHIQIT